MPLTLDAIDACLPQTQCTRCGYPRCRDYAEALAAGHADLNRCPPGGTATIEALARLLKHEPKPLDPDCGVHEPRNRAVIEEIHCIGCRKCTDACPVDAIVGAPKLMHTIIASECNGCALCLPPCPVDCIRLVPAAVPPNGESLWPEYPLQETTRWRQRTTARLARRLRTKNNPRPPARAQSDERTRIRAEIAAAVSRVRARRQT